VYAGIQEAIGNVTHPMTGSSELRRSPAVRQRLGSIAFCDGNRRAWLPRSTDAAPSAMFPVTFSNVNSNLAAFIDLTANYVPLPELPPKVYLLFSVIGLSNPASKLTVNGNLAIGANNNVAAPTNGASIQGWVGIGTANPIMPLDVENVGGPTSWSGQAAFFVSTSTALQNLTLTNNPGVAGSALFRGQVWCFDTINSFNGTFSGSDARLKKVIGQSDSQHDSGLLRQIEVTDFTYIDEVNQGSGIHKKVIAQQVEKLLPEAVQKRTTFIPDIYALASKVERVDGRYVITLPKPHGLSDGDRVRLILEKGADLYPTVKLVNDTSFCIPADAPINAKVFVYGKQHDDVRVVDYDAISMLNVSATQELARKVEALEEQNSDLENQAKRLTAVEEKEKATIAEQEDEIATLKAAASENAELKAEMEAMKKAVTKIQEKEDAGVRKVALE
jgi:uncharacterized protein YidB (DUF937 family)/polyhydroxyalkanoate synthesis regulator phasin